MFSTSCKYAIQAMLFMALKTDQENKIRVNELAEKIDVPKHFLAKILQELTKKKLVSSAKGRNGGFYLSDTNKASNLMEVVYSIDGNGQFENCILGLQVCNKTALCPYHHIVYEFRQSFQKELKNESIVETAKRLEENNLSLKIE